MENKFSKYYNDLPNWSKGIATIGVLVIAGVVGFTIYRNYKKKQELREDLKESETASEDLRYLQAKGQKPSLSNTQIDTIINNLVEAMNDCGTDEELVYAEFKKLNNLADVYALVSRWKVRYYRPCAALSPISFMRYQFNDKAFGGNISAWISYDMTNAERGKINKILSDKGINYKF